MSKLFEPVKINGMTLKNRVVMAPMCMYSADKQGRVNDWHKVHYATRAVGGVGLIIVEATAVEAHGRISDHDLGIWDDEHVAGLSEVVKLVKPHGTQIGIQLAHAGRKSEAEGTPVAPSPIAFSDRYRVPKELSRDEIHGVVRSFAKAAERAKQAGFDCIEIHAAHGYLINQFLSPLANQRTDEYGGGHENRFRLLKEVVLAVKEVWDGPLFVRVSAEEYADGGNHIEAYVFFSALLKELGVDLIHVSSGAVVPYPITDYPGYQVPLAEKIRYGADIPTAAVGKITTPEQAEEILQNRRADLISLARVLLRDPYWALHAQIALENNKESVPVQYQRGF
ncbi:NADPH dehydrogenase NamA [Brevibacillus dissolubilis]|uniref:NADPH dehydrogenase NamA n=1 Tax=Brevibacillus dissolubilis TaxID=1844116 RepID=UPI001116D941|nr:NADPH dehydrogenase NamA [Brevibacillus dissolubilis]